MMNESRVVNMLQLFIAPKHQCSNSCSIMCIIHLEKRNARCENMRLSWIIVNIEISYMVFKLVGIYILLILPDACKESTKLVTF